MKNYSVLFSFWWRELVSDSYPFFTLFNSGPSSDDLASRLLLAPTASESSRDIMFIN